MVAVRKKDGGGNGAGRRSREGQRLSHVGGCRSELGALIDEARVARGMSLRMLGKAAGGVIAGYIRDIILGRRLPTVELAGMLGEVLGISISEMEAAAGTTFRYKEGKPQVHAGMHSDAALRFGAWMDAARCKQQMSILELATGAGQSYSYTRDVLLGRWRPSTWCAEKLCGVLNVSFSDARHLYEQETKRVQAGENRLMLVRLGDDQADSRIVLLEREGSGDSMRVAYIELINLGKPRWTVSMVPFAWHGNYGTLEDARESAERVYRRWLYGDPVPASFGAGELIP